MATKKPSYIAFELEYLETKFKQFQAALDSYDLANLVDRYGPKELPNGKIVEAIIETRTDQMKAVMYMLEKLPKIVASLDELRIREAEKMEARGNASINPMMQREMLK